MTTVTFYNYHKQLFDPLDNLLISTVNLNNFPKDLQIIFPFNKLQHVFCSEQKLSNSELTETIDSAYRISFSPVQHANNPSTFEFPNLGCEGVNLAIGQEIVERLPYNNYFRLPMWCIELFGLLPTIQDIQNKINKLEALRKQNPFLRPKFLSLVAKRDKKCHLHSVKGMVLDLIADDNYLATLCTESAGRFRNNTTDLQVKFHDNKIEYLRQFTFNLCPESMHYFGVVSNKIAHCLEAGCIPIYWGDIYQDAKYFNLEALILFDPSKRMDLPLKIKEALYYSKDFVAQNIFNEHAAQFIFEDIYFPIFRKIETDLNIPIYSLRNN